MTRPTPGRWTAVAGALIVQAMLLASPALPSQAAGAAGTESVKTAVELEFYGYVKLDTAYNSSLSNTGNFLRWVELNPDNPDDDCFHMTANQTRAGLRINRSDEDESRLRTSGAIEIDFYGSGGAENKPQPMLRKAFVNIEWPDKGWVMLAGQTSDVISPLVPSTLNYSVAWWAGNIGYRRPQIRLTRRARISAASEFHATLALTRDIGSTASDFVAVDAGTDAGVPGVQGRLAWSVAKSRAAGPVTFGISGHQAREEFDLNAQGDTADFDSWSLNLDYAHPLSGKVALQVEAFTGANLAAYLGGIGNGINLTQMTEVASHGGWLALDLGPFDGWTWQVGYSLDDPQDRDLEALDRSQNQAVWASGVYGFSDYLRMGLEVSHWETDYKDAASADTRRGQFSVIYLF